MATYRRPLEGEFEGMAKEIAARTYRNVNNAVSDFVRELGGYDVLPKGFDLNSDTMRTVANEIDETAATGNISGTQELCAAYEKRFMDYLAAWREKLAAMNKEQAA